MHRQVGQLRVTAVAFVPRYGFIVGCMTNDAATDWVPESCSLPTPEQPQRLAEFDRLFAESVLRYTRPSPTRLDLVLASDAETNARHLAAREAVCCSFFGFGFELSGSDLVMSVAVPESRVDVLNALAARVSVVAADRKRSTR